MKKILFYGQVIFVGLFLIGCISSEMLQVSVFTDHGDYKFKVKVADTYEERLQGLQFVNELGRDEGMWFVFLQPIELNFWMKDTLIPLDIVFVNSDFKIINVVHNAPPCQDVDPEQTNCETYSSDGKAQYVLELNGGVADELGFKVGDQVSIPEN